MKAFLTMSISQNRIERRGVMLVLSSPSGAGKTVISRALIHRNSNLHLSVSMTTRLPRPGEKEGKDYYFVSKETFDKYCKEGAFLEYAEVFDCFYGTPRQPVEETLAKGEDILFDIDWQGAQSLSQSDRGDLVTIFILPPSWKELERRLHARAQDPQEVVKKRMAKATNEMSHWAEYDYVLINQDFEETVQNIQNILTAERLKRTRQISLKSLVDSLKPPSF